MSHVLVVDDDGHIREVVRFALEQGGYRVTCARDGAEAWTAFSTGGVDLVVLDVLMPEADGLDVCRRIRARASTPIIFLSSKDSELDRVLGLELGADDYLTKPFSPRELLARVKAVLRRIHEAPPATDERRVLRRGSLEMDLARHRVRFRGADVVLTVTEFALLEVLLGTAGRVYSRGQLVDRAYGQGHVITERTVDSHVRRIRQKLAAAGGEDAIETVYGLGYRLREELA
jgi:two-component system OmpR family response regulator